MKKALFFDVDGTLVDHMHGIHNVSDAVIKQLNRLKSEGHYIFIASGRPKAFIAPDLLKLGFDGFVLCNGSHVEFHDHIVYEQPLNHEYLSQLVDVLETHHCDYDLETAHGVYLSPKFKTLYDFFLSFDIPKESLFLEENLRPLLKETLKVELHISDEQQVDLQPYINDYFSYDNHGTQDSYEIYSKSDSKATGIEKLLDALNITRENSYAFGDGINDLEMIKYVGHGIAMNNGCNELKKVADDVCDDIANDGLAKYLKTIQ